MSRLKWAAGSRNCWIRSSRRMNRRCDFDPHPALRATLSQWERDNLQVIPYPSGRGWREAPGEGRKYDLTCITDCNINIAYRNMTLGEKLRYLRQLEGTLRGLEREMTLQAI